MLTPPHCAGGLASGPCPLPTPAGVLSLPLPRHLQLQEAAGLALGGRGPAHRLLPALLRRRRHLPPGLPGAAGGSRHGPGAAADGRQDCAGLGGRCAAGSLLAATLALLAATGLLLPCCLSPGLMCLHVLLIPPPSHSAPQPLPAGPPKQFAVFVGVVFSAIIVVLQFVHAWQASGGSSSSGLLNGRLQARGCFILRTLSALCPHLSACHCLSLACPIAVWRRCRDCRRQPRWLPSSPSLPAWRPFSTFARVRRRASAASHLLPPCAGQICCGLPSCPHPSASCHASCHARHHTTTWCRLLVLWQGHQVPPHPRHSLYGAHQHSARNQVRMPPPPP